jgi:hypothetical protein
MSRSSVLDFKYECEPFSLPFERQVAAVVILNCMRTAIPWDQASSRADHSFE